ncbi:MAG TPA: hypothetical protein VIK91_17685 [Nannocystis sp.]
MTYPYKVAHLATCGGLILALLAPAPAGAAMGRPSRLGGWNTPRWRLPAVRPPDCPEGYAGDRPLVHVRKARCKETGPIKQIQAERDRGPKVAPRPAPTPAAPTRPPEAPRPAPWPRAPSPAPAVGPSPDATALMAMGAAACHDYLREHEVEFVALSRAEAPEVDIPVRLRGPIAGVVFTIPWSSDLERDPHAIWDCQLVAAFVPIAEWLAARGVTEVQYFSALRRGKIVQQKPRSRHNVGLALDLYALRRGGDPLKVEDHYPRRRLRQCPAPGASGPGAPPPPGAPAGDLFLGLVCFAVERGLVHTLLTPDYDRAHANHLHLDLKAGQRSPADPFVSFHGT